MTPCDSLLPSLPLCAALFRWARLKLVCHLRPQAGDRYREHALAERHRLLSVVENDTEFEILAAGRGQLSKPLEIAGSDGCGRFDLNTNYISTLTFHDDVYFVLILISVVVKPARLGQPIHLFHDLRER